jgi:hypothetical protein
MIIRLAIFKGHVSSDKSAALDKHVTQKMLPLIATFPGISSVRVLRTDGGDGVLVDAFLALEMSYPDSASMERALASPERAQNALETEKMFEMVENPVVSHAVFDVAASG